MDEILKNVLISIKNILIVIICVGFQGAGMLKMVDYPTIVAEFKYWGFPKWSMYLIGIVEIILSIGVFYLPTRIQSLVGLIILMTGALIVHIIFGEVNFILAPIVLSAICGSIIYLENKIVKSK